MAKGANVTDFKVFKSMGVALDKYESETYGAISGVTTEIQRVFEWIISRENYWVKELERRNRELESAKQSLQRCESYSNNESNDGCYRERREYHRALTLFEEAKKELDNTKHWERQLNLISDSYSVNVAKFSHAREHVIQEGKKILSRQIQALQNYSRDGNSSQLLSGGLSLDDVPEIGGSKSEESGSQGKAFEDWCQKNVFKHEKDKLTQTRIELENNDHLDTDQNQGLTKSRRMDVWLNDRNEIWEMKSGYESNIVDQKQAREYSRMLDNGRINLSPGGGETIGKKVKLVNYLFQTRAGAEFNATSLREFGFGIFYIDGESWLKQLE